jgi:hypothetical protein
MRVREAAQLFQASSIVVVSDIAWGVSCSIKIARIAIQSCDGGCFVIGKMFIKDCLFV